MLIHILVNNWGGKRLGHLGQQSPQFLAKQIIKHGDESQQRFLKNFVDYICQRYKHLSACKSGSL
jgi:hypothetical protein